MFLKKIGLWAAACFCSCGLWAQAEFTVASDVANMGELMFQMPAKARFTVTNTGKDPLIISHIHPSCGCTTVEWTRTPIAAGSTGFIEAEYDAKMLGVFQKDLEVYTNASSEPVYLHLQGRVVSTLTNYEGLFPVGVGQIRLSTNNVEFEDVNKGDRPVAEIALVNTSRQSYIPTLMHIPPYLDVKYLPEKLSGGRIGKIQLTLDSEKLYQLGLNQTSVYLAKEPGDKVSEENEIVISAVLLPDFSGLSAEELARAPKLELSADSLSIGKMGLLNRKSATIRLYNKGKDPLEIRAIQVSNRSLGISLSNRRIEAGTSAKLKITVHGKYLNRVKNRPRVILITNDPQMPKVVIPIKVAADAELKGFVGKVNRMFSN